MKTPVASRETAKGTDGTLAVPCPTVIPSRIEDSLSTSHRPVMDAPCCSRDALSGRQTRLIHRYPGWLEHGRRTDAGG